MKALGQRYAQYMDRTDQRSGTLLPGRSRQGLAARQCRESRDGRPSVLNQSPEPYLMGDTRVNVNL